MLSKQQTNRLVACHRTEIVEVTTRSADAVERPPYGRRTKTLMPCYNYDFKSTAKYNIIFKLIVLDLKIISVK